MQGGCCGLAVLLSALVLCRLAPAVSAAKGVVSLDSLTFAKVIRRFPFALVKFDKTFASGAVEDAYNEFAQLAVPQHDLLVASVAVSPYGSKDNEDLAEEYGISPADFPKIKLLPHGQNTAGFTFEGNATMDALLSFARESSQLYIGRIGCLEAFDALAHRTIPVSTGNVESIYLEAKALQRKLLEEEKIASAEMYMKIMSLIIMRGKKFPIGEITRVRKLLKTKLTDEKKKEMELRLNVLHSFVTEKRVAAQGKDEL